MRGVGRYGGTAVGLAVLLTALPPYRLTAQVSLHLSAGARYTSTLVHDSIVNPFDVRPALAPLVALAVATPLNPPWSAEATLDLSWSALERRERDGGGTTADLGGLATLSAGLGIGRRLGRGFSTRIDIGGLKYLPADERGIFRDGAGSLLPFAALALAYAPPFGARYGLALEGRYDFHRFHTSALQNAGIPSRAVHRVALALRAGTGRGGGGAAR